MTAYFLSQIIQGRRQWSNNFKVLEGQPKSLYLAKMRCFRQIKAEIIYYQLICIIGKVKRNSSCRRKMLSVYQMLKGRPKYMSTRNPP